MFTRRPARPEGARLEGGDQVSDLFDGLRAQDRRDLDESRESTLLLVVLGLLLFLALSSYGERIAGWWAVWRAPAAAAEPAAVAPAPAPAPQ